MLKAELWTPLIVFPKDVLKRSEDNAVHICESVRIVFFIFAVPTQQTVFPVGTGPVLSCVASSRMSVKEILCFSVSLFLFHVSFLRCVTAAVWSMWRGNDCTLNPRPARGYVPRKRHVQWKRVARAYYLLYGIGFQTGLREGCQGFHEVLMTAWVFYIL